MEPISCRCGVVLFDGRKFVANTHRLSRRADGTPIRGTWTWRAKDKPLCRRCADEAVARKRG